MKISLNKTRKYIPKIAALMSILLFMACLKKDDSEPLTSQDLLNAAIANVDFDQLQNDLEIIDEFIEISGLTEEILQEPNGVRYRIHSMGTGPMPNLRSNIRLKFSGRALSTNEEIESNDDFETVIFNTIIGFQTTLPLLPEGTVATLFIPSGFAFGPQEYRDENGDIYIPLNAIVVYNIELLEVL